VYDRRPVELRGRSFVLDRGRSRVGGYRAGPDGVSVHVLSWAWKQRLGNPTRKLVLLKLADSANDDGECWPYQTTIAEDVGISRRSVERHIAGLRDAGLVVTKQQFRDDGSKTYVVYGLAYQAAPLPTPVSGTPDASDPGLPTPVSGDARASGDEPLEPSVEPPPVAPPFPKTVGRRRVTVDEQRLAESILLEFNDVFSTRFTIAAWGAKLVLRIREHSGLDRADHRRIIEAQARAPWWSGSPSPSVIYGNAAIFERAIQTSIEPDDLSRKLTPEQIAERFRGRA